MIAAAYTTLDGQIFQVVLAIIGALAGLATVTGLGIITVRGFAALRSEVATLIQAQAVMDKRQGQSEADIRVLWDHRAQHDTRLAVVEQAVTDVKALLKSIDAKLDDLRTVHQQ